MTDKPPGDARARWTRRALVGGVLSAPVLFAARPVGTLVLSDWRESRHPPPAPLLPGLLDDASGLESTRVGSVVAPSEADAVFASAARVCIGGERHSMGGHTLLDGGTHVATGRDPGVLGVEADAIEVRAGTTWREVLAALRPLGRSVAVMQSNNDFSVGGSVSVNAHGWQTGRGPVGTTVRAMTVRLASGERLVCSPTVEPELFCAILGGYGLIALIESVTLETVPDTNLVGRTLAVAPEDYLAAWTREVAQNPLARLSYGRWCVAPGSFLTDGTLSVLEEAPGVVSPAPPPLAALTDRAVRDILRGSVGSDYGKGLRWRLERLSGGEAALAGTRNQVLDTSVAAFENRDPTRVDVLFEAFVPHSALVDWRDRMQQILPLHPVDLLNVTVRDVSADPRSLLRYARTDCFATVLLFNQERSPAADAGLDGCVRALIDAALDLGGTFYLPYRRSAKAAQLARGYPDLAAFAAARDRFDPGRKFGSRFAAAYGL